jgi:succinate dehydrogenase/fumarate reductase flavoprotein subunit
MERIHLDVIVLGSGGAGLRAAIEAASSGLKVGVVSKGATGMAGATVISAGVLAARAPDEPPGRHLKRTLDAGRGINQLELVEVLVREGPLRIRELLDWGIRARMMGGTLFALGRPPARGHELVRTLRERASSAGVSFMGSHMAARIRTMDGMWGVLVHSAGRNRWLALTAPSVVLAMGGASALYERHDNPQRAMGDGYSLALEAGAVLQDMEFVQFYPLALAEPRYPPLVISPLLADRGRLVNSSGEDIHHKYEITERPAGEKARDRLSQALFREIQKLGREIWLDISGLPPQQWESDPFSASVMEILKGRFGLGAGPIRLAPVAHHVMGGVRIDIMGATNLPGLFAAGEVTGGLHGANRLGGNALTETLVFGARAGASAARWAADNASGSPPGALIEELESLVPPPSPDAPHSGEILRLKGRLRRLMWEKAGIIRDLKGLEEAAEELSELESLPWCVPHGGTARDIQWAVELWHGIRAARLIIESAIRREESRGAHFREDHPNQDDTRFLCHIQVSIPKGHREPAWRVEKISHARLPGVP